MTSTLVSFSQGRSPEAGKGTLTQENKESFKWVSCLFGAPFCLCVFVCFVLKQRGTPPFWGIRSPQKKNDTPQLEPSIPLTVQAQADFAQRPAIPGARRDGSAPTALGSNSACAWAVRRPASFSFCHTRRVPHLTRDRPNKSAHFLGHSNNGRATMAGRSKEIEFRGLVKQGYGSKKLNPLSKLLQASGMLADIGTFRSGF